MNIPITMCRLCARKPVMKSPRHNYVMSTQPGTLYTCTDCAKKWSAYLVNTAEHKRRIFQEARP